MESLKVTFEVITPLACGGARPNHQAEFRAASLRGVLRSWLERLCPGAGDKAFGSAGERTASGSPVAVHVGWASRSTKFTRDLHWRPSFKAPGRQYFGYSFILGGNDRCFIGPGEGFVVELIPCIPVLSEAIRRSWVASIWLLDRFGGMGNRSRRGYGSLQVKSWEGWAGETGKLRLTKDASGPEEWKRDIEAGWKELRGWLSAPPGGDRRIVNGESCILRQPQLNWEGVLDFLAEKYKGFRKGLKPEERAVFGLPLIYKNDKLSIKPKEGRSASRILFKAARLRDGKLYPVVTRLDGCLMPHGCPVQDKVFLLKKFMGDLNKTGLGVQLR